jgi:hypothetical protein
MVYQDRPISLDTEHPIIALLTPGARLVKDVNPYLLQVFIRAYYADPFRYNILMPVFGIFYGFHILDVTSINATQLSAIIGCLTAIRTGDRAQPSKTPTTMLSSIRLAHVCINQINIAMSQSIAVNSQIVLTITSSLVKS